MKKETVEVYVTKEHLRDGSYENPLSCPIALAIRSTLAKTNTALAVSKDRVYFDYKWWTLKARDDRKAFRRNKYKHLRNLLGGFKVTLTAL